VGWIHLAKHLPSSQLGTTESDSVTGTDNLTIAQSLYTYYKKQHAMIGRQYMRTADKIT
jgi:hypothetical protein